VGPAHLEFLGDLEGVCRAKGELLAHIQPQGTVVLNQDDRHLVALAKRSPCQVLFFGTSSRAQVRAEAIAETHAGIGFDLVLPEGRARVRLNSPGRFMVPNALAAAAAGYLSGIDIAKIVRGLESFQPVAGRLRVVQTDRGVRIIDDTYNANPQSMIAAISTFAALHKSDRGFIVLGDMLELGDRAEALHQEVGRVAAQAGADRIYGHGDYAGALMAGARTAGMREENLMIGTKEELAADLIRRLQPQDWVLVKGSRGMAMEAVVKALVQWAQPSADG